MTCDKSTGMIRVNNNNNKCPFSQNVNITMYYTLIMSMWLILSCKPFQAGCCYIVLCAYNTLSVKQHYISIYHMMDFKCYNNTLICITFYFFTWGPSFQGRVSRGSIYQWPRF